MQAYEPSVCQFMIKRMQGPVFFKEIYHVLCRLQHITW